MMYRVFIYTDKRKRQLRRVDSKRVSRWDEAKEPAVWKTSAAANMWAKRQGYAHGYEVIKQV